MLIELRVLLGPNADIPAPAIRVTLAGPTPSPAWTSAETTDAMARAADAFVGAAVTRTAGDGRSSWRSPGSGRGSRRGDGRRPRGGPADGCRRFP